MVWQRTGDEGMNALYDEINCLREELEKKDEEIKKLKSENGALKAAVQELQEFVTRENKTSP